MGQARELMDRITAAAFETKDIKAVAECYADNAVAVTPDAGEITGKDQIAEYMRQFVDAFPDASYETVAEHESGNVAIDEGYIVGTHTRPLVAPTGETIPPTGKRIRVRGCDVATVEGGRIVAHRMYFDQMDFLGQLGLLPDTPA